MGADEEERVAIDGKTECEVVGGILRKCLKVDRFTTCLSADRVDKLTGENNGKKAFIRQSSY